MSIWFNTSVVGIAFKNPDGTDRQKIISKCKKEEPLMLTREPNEKYDKNAICVFRETDEQLGYVDNEQAKELGDHIDKGGEVQARIRNIHEPGEIYDFYGCTIDIQIGDIPYIQKEHRAKDLIEKAKDNENKYPLKAIEYYLKAVRMINEEEKLIRNTLMFQRDGKNLRKVGYPINELTRVLEKEKEYMACLIVIKRYEGLKDSVGLTKKDLKTIKKRKKRILKKYI